MKTAADELRAEWRALGIADADINAYLARAGVEHRGMMTENELRAAIKDEWRTRDDLAAKAKAHAEFSKTLARVNAERGSRRADFEAAHAALNTSAEDQQPKPTLAEERRGIEELARKHYGSCGGAPKP